MVAVGIVAGEVIALSIQRVMATFSPQLLEAIAICKGLLFAKQTHLLTGLMVVGIFILKLEEIVVPRCCLPSPSVLLILAVRRCCSPSVDRPANPVLFSTTKPRLCLALVLSLFSWVSFVRIGVVSGKAIFGPPLDDYWKKKLQEEAAAKESDANSN
ncbi:hypothetical protein Q3G72_034634 [Acer saccharum]|nr:hypothetical protein Q3G72_034634 [Acer saccharum]